MLVKDLHAAGIAYVKDPIPGFGPDLPRRGSIRVRCTSYAHKIRGCNDGVDRTRIGVTSLRGRKFAEGDKAM